MGGYKQLMIEARENVLGGGMPRNAYERKLLEEEMARLIELKTRRKKRGKS